MVVRDEVVRVVQEPRTLSGLAALARTEDGLAALHVRLHAGDGGGDRVVHLVVAGPALVAGPVLGVVQRRVGLPVALSAGLTVVAPVVRRAADPPETAGDRYARERRAGSEDLAPGSRHHLYRGV